MVTKYRNIQCDIQSVKIVGEWCELRVDTKCKSIGAEIRDYFPCSLESKIKVGGKLGANINQGSLGGYYWESDR